jgi:hypothetical protein
MRAQGVRGLLIYCADYRCSHSIAIYWRGGLTASSSRRSSRVRSGLICFAPPATETGGTGVEAPRPAISGRQVEVLGEDQEPEASAMGRVMETFG